MTTGGQRDAAGKYELTPQAKGKYAMATWAEAAAEANQFSPTEEGELAKQLVGGARAAVTNANYNSKMKQLLQFCGSREPPIDAAEMTEVDFVEYVAWQACRGRIRMTKKNFQPYLSCHSTMMAELGLKRVAVDSDAINNALAAAGRRQLLANGDSERRGRRQALPARVALDMVEAAEECWCEAGRPAAQLETLRPLLATASAFQWLDRPRTGYSARWQDFGVALSGAAPGISFFENESKTNLDGTLGKRQVTLQIGDGARNLQRRLGRLLNIFKALKRQLCPALAVDGQAFWAITGDADAASWTSEVQGSWLQDALEHIDAAPPENFVWTGYSLRHGGTSAASAAGVPMPQIRHLGGWAKRSTTPEDHYIDPLVLATEAGRAFFGFLAAR